MFLFTKAQAVPVVSDRCQYGGYSIASLSLAFEAVNKFVKISAFLSTFRISAFFKLVPTTMFLASTPERGAEGSKHPSCLSLRGEQKFPF